MALEQRQKVLLNSFALYVFLGFPSSHLSVRQEWFSELKTGEAVERCHESQAWIYHRK